MWSKLRNILRWSTLVAMGLVIIFVGRDSYVLNPAQRAATPYTYDLVAWEATNFLSKWVHKLGDALPWNRLSDDDRLRQVDEYFALGDEVADVQTGLDRAAANGESSASEVVHLENELDRIGSRREGLRKDVEETIESMISSVVSEDGLGSFGELLFPPVDIRLSSPPKLLVTSQRDRIDRTHDVLLEPDISLQEREELETDLLRDSNLSALVVRIGGVATYPASLPNDRPLQSTLQTAAHEWLHHYFFFKPLGQHMFTSDEMQTLNETAAEIAGREIGDRVFQKLRGNVEVDQQSSQLVAEDEAGFQFDFEMRETRSRVDELLAQGRVEDAESYMEERRLLFVENGIFIRKLNQAYFAFHGTYAESPTSVSPIGDQLHSFRNAMPNLGTFIREVSQVSNYDEFLKRLTEIEPGQVTPEEGWDTIKRIE